MSKSLDPDQVRHYVGPAQSPNFCKGFQQKILVGKAMRQKKCYILMLGKCSVVLGLFLFFRSNSRIFFFFRFCCSDGFPNSGAFYF